MTQEEGEEQDAAEDGKLGGLEIPEAEVEPTAGTEDLHPDEEDQDEQDDAQDVDREGTEADPLIVVEGDEEEDR